MGLLFRSADLALYFGFFDVVNVYVLTLFYYLTTPSFETYGLQLGTPLILYFYFFFCALFLSVRWLKLWLYSIVKNEFRGCSSVPVRFGLGDRILNSQFSSCLFLFCLFSIFQYLVCLRFLWDFELEVTLPELFERQLYLLVSLHLKLYIISVLLLNEDPYNYLSVYTLSRSSLLKLLLWGVFKL